MSPFEWRKSAKLSQDQLARDLGVRGENPARTWSRWELGEREPPVSVIAKIETLSGGAVNAAAWHEVRIAHLGKVAA